MKKLILIALIFLSGNFIQAQNIARSIIPTAGASDNLQLSWTLGSIFTETYSAGGFVLEQGYYQNNSFGVTGNSVAIKIALQGAYDLGANLMRDNLRSEGLIPLNQPYTFLGFAHNGTESISPDVLTSTGHDAIIDWIGVELRDKSNASQVKYSRIGLLQRDGDIVDLDGVSPLRFPDAPSDSYYIAILHRNHLGISSAEPISLSSTPTNLDFTNGSIPLFGVSSQTIINGIHMLWAGDADGDGRIIYAGAGTDVNAISSDVFTNPLNIGFSPSFPFEGYSRSDLNMDGNVIYAGAGTDVNFISAPVFVHTGNGGLSATFVVFGQLP